jgi:hypothetical protein
MPTLKNNGILWWRRYVDDTFVAISENTDINILKRILNNFHDNIQFTHEEGLNGTLPFLDINYTKFCKYFFTFYYNIVS